MNSYNDNVENYYLLRIESACDELKLLYENELSEFFKEKNSTIRCRILRVLNNRLDKLIDEKSEKN